MQDIAEKNLNGQLFRADSQEALEKLVSKLPAPATTNPDTSAEDYYIGALLVGDSWSWLHKDQHSEFARTKNLIALPGWYPIETSVPVVKDTHFNLLVDGSSAKLTPQQNSQQHPFVFETTNVKNVTDTKYVTLLNQGDTSASISFRGVTLSSAIVSIQPSVADSRITANITSQQDGVFEGVVKFLPLAGEVAGIKSFEMQLVGAEGKTSTASFSFNLQESNVAPEGVSSGTIRFLEDSYTETTYQKQVLVVNWEPNENNNVDKELSTVIESI